MLFRSGNGKYGANNYDDDTVSALYWACYLFLMDIVDDIEFMKSGRKSMDDDAWGVLSDAVDDTFTDEWFITM